MFLMCTLRILFECFSKTQLFDFVSVRFKVIFGRLLYMMRHFHFKALHIAKADFQSDCRYGFLINLPFLDLMRRFHIGSCSQSFHFQNKTVQWITVPATISIFYYQFLYIIKINQKTTYIWITDNVVGVKRLVLYIINILILLSENCEAYLPIKTASQLPEQHNELSKVGVWFSVHRLTN